MNKLLERLKQLNKKGDKQLIVLSIIVAIVMWTFVTTSTNPSTNRTFRNIPLIIQNQDKLEDSGYTIMSKDEANSVTVRLTGSRDKIVGLNQNDIQASINVMDAREGINSLNVKIDTPTGIYVDSVDPRQINLNIQRIVTKSLPVNIVIKDQLKDSKIVEVNEQNPKQITIKGAESVVNKVDRIEARIDDVDYLDGKIHNIPIKVFDKAGKSIEDIELDAKDVNISFLVYETKKVDVELKTKGKIAEGYVETLSAISPDSIVIKGPGSIIKHIDAIKTLPINITNLKTSKNGEVKLLLPEGVEVYDGENIINYRIEVQKIPDSVEENED